MLIWCLHAQLCLSAPPPHCLCSRCFNVFKCEVASDVTCLVSVGDRGRHPGHHLVEEQEEQMPGWYHSRCVSCKLSVVSSQILLAASVSAFCSRRYMALILFDVFLKPLLRYFNVTFDQADSLTLLLACCLRCRLHGRSSLVCLFSQPMLSSVSKSR